MESYCNEKSSKERCYRTSTNQSGYNQMNHGYSRNARSCNRYSQNSDRSVQNGNRQMMQENRSRNIEVECVCKVTSKADCHKHDEMEKLGNDFPVVMAYVPWQQWGELYDADCGLMQGTIFKDLNFIFCGERC